MRRQKDAISWDLQWPSHVSDALQGGGLFECFVFVKNLAVAHESVKPKLDERMRCAEVALKDASTGRHK